VSVRVGEYVENFSQMKGLFGERLLSISEYSLKREHVNWLNLFPVVGTLTECANSTRQKMCIFTQDQQITFSHLGIGARLNT